MHNLSVVLAAAGASLADVVKTTSFIVGYRPEQRKIITDAKEPFYQGRRPPTSAVVGVSTPEIPLWLIEIEGS
jgi:enamine deaminase RidA (YjgF/YER057c/UK114 family)